MKSMKKIFLVLLMLTVCITAVSADGWIIKQSEIVSILKNFGCKNVETQDLFVTAQSNGNTFGLLNYDDYYLLLAYLPGSTNTNNANYWNQNIPFPTMYIADDNKVCLRALVNKDGITKENLKTGIGRFLYHLDVAVDFLSY